MHRNGQDSERAQLEELWRVHDLVCAAQHDGRPIDPGADHKAWKAPLTPAEVSDARLHDARHTAATVQLQEG